VTEIVKAIESSGETKHNHRLRTGAGQSLDRLADIVVFAVYSILGGMEEGENAEDVRTSPRSGDEDRADASVETEVRKK
jgi:hypothetical protein